MRALGFAVIAALISVSVVEGTDAFARSAGNGAAGAAGGASGGTSGGTAGGGGGGSHAAVDDLSVIGRNPPPRLIFFRTFRAHVEGSCFKQEHLYDRFGDPVVNMPSNVCFGQ
jgi:hypothetical protein